MRTSDRERLRHDVVTGRHQPIEAEERERIQKAEDVQLERAYDLLKGLALYTQRHPSTDKKAGPEKMAAK